MCRLSKLSHVNKKVSSSHMNSLLKQVYLSFNVLVNLNNITISGYPFNKMIVTVGAETK